MFSRIRFRKSALALGAAALMAFEARAATISFEAPQINLTESSSVQTGYFNVLVFDSNTSDQLNAFDADVTISGSQIGLTSAGSNTSATNGLYGPSAAYALSATGGAGTAAGTDYNSSISAVAPPSGYNEAYNTDTSSSNSIGQALSPTTPYGLLQVGFTVPANTVGDFTLSFYQPSPLSAGYNDAYFVSAPTVAVFPNFTSGYINVAAVPEPSSWALAVAAGLGVVAYYMGLSRLRNAKLAARRAVA